MKEFDDFVAAFDAQSGAVVDFGLARNGLDNNTALLAETAKSLKAAIDAKVGSAALEADAIKATIVTPTLPPIGLIIGLATPVSQLGAASTPATEAVAPQP